MAEFGRFSSRLAGVLFDDQPLSALDPAEIAAVDRFESLVSKIDKIRLTELALRIDKVLIPCLSGGSMLRVARRIEEKCPEVIGLMPRLSAQHNHLVRSAEVADAFSFTSLDRLVNAIREESSRS